MKAHLFIFFILGCSFAHLILRTSALSAGFNSGDARARNVRLSDLEVAQSTVVSSTYRNKMFFTSPIRLSARSRSNWLCDQKLLCHDNRWIYFEYTQTAEIWRSKNW